MLFIWLSERDDRIDLGWEFCRLYIGRFKGYGVEVLEGGDQINGYMSLGWIGKEMIFEENWKLGEDIGLRGLI